MKSSIKYVLAAALLCASLSLGPARGQAPVYTQSVVLTPRLDVFQTRGQRFALTGTPAANTGVMVYVNGLLMLGGTDYTLSGTALTFTGQEIGESPIIQALYWVIAPSPAAANAELLPGWMSSTVRDAVASSLAAANAEPLPSSDAIKAIQERGARERAAAERIAYQVARQPGPAPAPAPPPRQLSPEERQQFYDALDRYFRENPGRIPIFWTPPGR
jgi:hypothetical protein